MAEAGSFAVKACGQCGRAILKLKRTDTGECWYCSRGIPVQKAKKEKKR